MLREDEKMDSNYLDMLKCLNKAGVDYIMVGGWAVNLHGYVRATIDLEDLIANKRASGRTKDLADAEILEGLGK